MTVRKVEIERLSVISSKPFGDVLATLEAAIGHPDIVEFMNAMHASHTFAEFESVVHKQLGATGLMMFMKFDHGAIIRKETGLNTPKIMRYVIGNPLIMKEMAKHVPDAGAYAPVTILVDDGLMACIYHMTRWPVFYLRIETLMLLLLLRTWIRRLRSFFESLQCEE